jgi:hypothetical protein
MLPPVAGNAFPVVNLSLPYVLASPLELISLPSYLPNSSLRLAPSVGISKLKAIPSFPTSGLILSCIVFCLTVVPTLVEAQGTLTKY